MKPHGGHRSRRKSNGLVALSSAAVLTVYSAGYLRTRAEAERFANDDARRPVIPAPAVPAAPPATPILSAAVEPATPAPAVAPIAKTETRAPKRREADRPPATPAVAQPAAPVTAANPSTIAPAVSAPAAPAAASPAPASDVTAPEAAAPAPAPQPQYKDGTYFGWGTSRHGDIQAYVVIESGRISVAAIAQCLTRYSCSWIAHLPGQVIGRQSADVDYVTGATQSTNAFYYAIVEALSKAK